MKPSIEGPLRGLRKTLRHPSNDGHRVASAARYLGWQVRQAVRGDTVDVELVPGRLVRCYPRTSSSSAVLYRGLYDWEEMHFLLHFVRSTETVIDVGANVGVYTLLASSVPGASVVAVEASTEAVVRLRENLALNELGDVRVIHAAAGAVAGGTAALTTGLGARNRVVSSERMVRGRVVDDDDAKTDQETVPTVRLDDVVGPKDLVSLVKIDVEGHEAAVLAGASGLLSEQRPAVIIELNDAAIFYEILAPLGYVTVRYDPVGRRLEAGAEPDPDGSQNLIAVPDLEAARARVAGSPR